MRSIRLMAATTVIVTLATACGDGGGVGPNDPPVAAFTPPSCTAGTACAFTSTSTDDNGITAYLWTFGDANAPVADQTSTLPNPSHTYSAANTYTVSLMVTDASGETNTTSHPVTVAAAGNLPPVASFTPPTGCTANTACTFTSTSTDADGQINLTSWDFGGGVILQGATVSHSFAAAGTPNVTLTVTDNLGATGTVTLPVTVSPPTAADCTTSGTFVNCILSITQRSTVRITLSDEDCELGGNQFRINDPARARQVIFFNGCSEIDGTQYVVDDATGAPIVFEAGEQIVTQFRQGTAGPGDPTPGFPAARLEGTFPNWTMRIDDGGAPGPGEPDYNDLVLAIQATP